jgi:aminoglycoside phosphotransferase (APT) family kinase protein
VLRKKPAGKLLTPTAHAVEREYQVLSALYTYSSHPSTPPSRRIPVPRPIVLCDDPEVIGTPFYIMEFLEGRIFTDPKMPGLTVRERRAWCASNSLVNGCITRGADCSRDAAGFLLCKCLGGWRCSILTRSA